MPLRWLFGLIVIAELSLSKTEAGPLETLRALASRCFHALAGSGKPSPQAIPPLKDSELPSPQLILSAKPHFFVSWLAKELGEHSDVGPNSSAQLRPIIFEFIREYNDFLIREDIQWSGREESETAGPGILQWRGGRKEFARAGEARAFSVYLFAKEKFKGLSPMIQERLDLYRDLISRPNIDIFWLERWLAFNILAQRGSLAATNQKMLLHHLDELGALDIVDRAYMGPKPHLVISPEVALFKGQELPMSFDIFVEKTRRNEDDRQIFGGREIGLVEVKQPDKFEKPADLRPSIVSTVAALRETIDLKPIHNPKSEQLSRRQKVGMFVMGRHEKTPLGNPTVGDVFYPVTMIIQVDWNFESTQVWKAGNQEIRRTPDGEIFIGERSIGTLIDQIEKMLSEIPGSESIHLIRLADREAGTIATFFLSADLSDDPFFMSDMDRDAPEFAKEIRSKKWVGVPGEVLEFVDLETGKSSLAFHPDQIGADPTSPPP